MAILPTPTSNPSSPENKISYLAKTFPCRATENSTRVRISHEKGLPYENSIASICFHGTIWEKIDATATAGFDSIEIMTSDLDEATPEQILDYCDAQNLTVSILQPFRDLEGYTCENEFNSKLHQFEKYLIACKALGADRVLLCSNCDENSVPNVDLVVSQLRRAADLAAKYDVKIAYENLSWAKHYKELDKLVEVIERVSKVNFGVCVDLFHINIHSSSFECLRRLPCKIFFVQFCDSPPLTKDIDILEHARNYRVFPSQGSYNNISYVMELLELSHYDGPLSLEVFNKSYKDRQGYCSYVAEDALRSLVYLQMAYTDLHKGTNYLPLSQITGIEILQDFSDWSSVQMSFGSPEDKSSFLKRTQTLGFLELGEVSLTLNPGLSKKAIIRVSSRLAFNRLALVICTALGLARQEWHELNVSNSFNLPLQSVFGNTIGVIIVLSLSEASTEKEFKTEICN